MNQSRLFDILVAGTGPSGLIAALAFARENFSVALIGPAPDHSDRRTTALMQPALEFLGSLVSVDALADVAAPLRVMRIVDATGRLICSRPVTFRASEIGEDRFGLNVPNATLTDALADAVRGDRRIDWRQTMVAGWQPEADAVTAELADGASVRGRLAVAADGRNSAARAAAGIANRQRPYRQAALVLSFRHSRPHADVSTEFHTETGPFTQVPLPGNRSSLVWVTSPSEAERLAALDDSALARQIEQRMQSMLGKVDVEPGRQVYPLAAGLPSQFGNNRIALVGEAAHLVPPIGAQGLNLGVRDVQDLVAVVRENRADPGGERVLARYDSRRRPDILLRSGAVDLLNRSLLSAAFPAQLARTAALSVLANAGPVRALFMREGMRPGSGLRALFSGVGREELRR